jgi:long-chain acyl-CoA synthetase
LINLFDHLKSIWSEDLDRPIIIFEDRTFNFRDLINVDIPNLTRVLPGDVVALIGDFDPRTIVIFLRLVEIGAIVVPLTTDTISEHEEFFKICDANYVISGNQIIALYSERKNEMLEKFKIEGKPGLILFSSGTSGINKAILHNFENFLLKYHDKRRSYRTLSFLLFDHIGGINTLLHTLFNLGTVIVPKNRSVNSILKSCQNNAVELLPTTPTFLRMLSLGSNNENLFPKSMKVITYGTERMFTHTLEALCLSYPNIDFRQTYGMSELGILQIRSEARDSLYFKIISKDVLTRIDQNELIIKSPNRMIGYLNSPNPFNESGWYATSDIVETKGEFIKIVGRKGDQINIGGLKFYKSEIEDLALKFKGVEYAKVKSRENPITGQHIELDVQVAPSFSKENFFKYLRDNLPTYKYPSAIRFKTVEINHRFKMK